MHTLVDINLFVHNGDATVGAAIESVLNQSYTAWRMTLIDDGSTDGTYDILAGYASRFPNIEVKQNRCNTGAVGAFQRGLWLGNADFVIPKSSDDLIAPDFVSKLMSILDQHPDCVMAHAGALSFSGNGSVQFEYPPSHRLHAVGPDPLQRARHVMTHYTSAPSFWGIYRRHAIDLLAPIAHRAGWDHVLLAELALYGEIRHNPELLYWRRGTGRPVLDLARAATHEAIRGLALNDALSDSLWRMPCITTAFAHIENIGLARLQPAQRELLLQDAASIFRRRWGAAMRREAQAARQHIAQASADMAKLASETKILAHLQLTRMIAAMALILPDMDLAFERDCLARMIAEPMPCLT